MLCTSASTEMPDPILPRPLMAIKSKKFWSAQYSSDTCPGQEDEGTLIYHVIPLIV